MLLAIDIGNTNIVAGMFEGRRLVVSWRIATDRHRMSDEYGVLLRSLFDAATISYTEAEAAIVCGVVPMVQPEMLQAIRAYFRLEPLVVSQALDLGLKVSYDPPQAVGADRLANAVAALAVYGRPAIVVDFGTTTNFDVISAEGVYVGGALAPGLEVSQEALFAHAAQLHPVPLEPPPHAVGSSTTESLQSGILYGYAGLIDGLVERISQELTGEPHVIATGGLSPIVAPHTRRVRHIDPDLTLAGLQLIHERNTVPIGSARARED